MLSNFDIRPYNALFISRKIDSPFMQHRVVTRYFLSGLVLGKTTFLYSFGAYNFSSFSDFRLGVCRGDGTYEGGGVRPTTPSPSISFQDHWKTNSSLVSLNFYTPRFFYFFDLRLRKKTRPRDPRNSLKNKACGSGIKGIVART